MSVAPVHPETVYVRNASNYLAAFSLRHMPTVVSWVGDDRELFWLAPRTVPPLNACKVLEWPGPDGCPMLFFHQGDPIPRGYLELNPLPGQRDQWWIGHCLVHPRWRGLGIGREMVRLLLDEAFLHRSARAVSLVVFPENVYAVRCYRAAGLVHIGEQMKQFPTSNQRHTMLLMQITQRQYQRIHGM